MRLGYVHLGRFPVQRRVAQQPSLSGKPFVLVEEVKGQRRVAFASTAALRQGVRVGMTLTAATALAGELPAFSYDPDQERAALGSLGESLMAWAPAFELSAPDGLWLDASAAHLCRGEEGWMAQVLAHCAESGLRAKIAVAAQRFTARALARYGEHRARVVRADEAAQALAPLPLLALDGAERPLGAPLSSLGLSSLGEVAALPPGALVARLGAAGLRAHRLCRGQDDTLLCPTPPLAVVEERVELDWPAEAVEPLLFAMKRLLDRLCARLSARRQAVLKLRLTLGLSHDAPQALPLVLARPSASAKLLVDLAKHRIADLTLPSPVAWLHALVEESVEDRAQQLLLGERVGEAADLEGVLARLSSTLGEDALFSVEVLPVHRPERGYAARAFRPPRALPGLLGEAERGAAPVPALAAEAGVHLERPARLFDPPARLDAEVLAEGQLVAARLLGKRRRALSIAGPERLCGEWWDGAPFHRDYYRVHFEGAGPAWIFRDAADGCFYLQGLFD
jgi:protein ImuB